MTARDPTIRPGNLLLALMPLLAGGCLLCPDCRDDRAGRGTAHAPRPVAVNPALRAELSGVVTYLERISMHPAAVVVVELRQTGADGVPSEPVASLAIDRPGQVPVFFILPVDALDPDADYTVSARILVEDTVLFASDTAYPVLTKGRPENVQLVLARRSTD